MSSVSRVCGAGMYIVVKKLRTGEPLTPKERKVHEVAACGVLRDLHDELDRLVADAYGWPWPMETAEILARVVALHDERVEEERRGVVRWLRPEYQVSRFGDRVEADQRRGAGTRNGGHRGRRPAGVAGGRHRAAYGASGGYGGRSRGHGRDRGTVPGGEAEGRGDAPGDAGGAGCGGAGRGRAVDGAPRNGPA
jgi:hypothetical protein